MELCLSSGCIQVAFKWKSAPFEATCKIILKSLFFSKELKPHAGLLLLRKRFKMDIKTLPPHITVTEIKVITNLAAFQGMKQTYTLHLVQCCCCREKTSPHVK